MTGAASLAWLAHHEFRLAWRDWLAMLTAGKRRRARVVALAFLAFAVFMHFVAYSVVAQFAEIEVDTDRGTLVVITGCALLAWSLMMSQAMESVTRAFYARSDLDLILSSPVIAQRVFAVRIATTVPVADTPRHLRTRNRKKRPFHRINRAIVSICP